MIVVFLNLKWELDFASVHCSFCFQDGKLTKEEIVDKYDLFVGSQATDFGEALVRHDEFWAPDRGTHISSKVIYFYSFWFHMKLRYWDCYYKLFKT